MFTKKKPPTIKSLIAQGTRVQGGITFSDGLRVDGEVEGDIVGDAAQASILVISETAHVVGAVRADHVIINGNVAGPVHAGELLELQPKACIQGDVRYRALEMHQGALIAGQLFPMEMPEEKPLLKLAANNP